MKSKIISILVGMGIMGILVGCGQVINTVQASEDGYLKYCGTQNIFEDTNGITKRIEVYEDTEHGKLVYVSLYPGYRLDLTVVDNK